MGGKRGGGGGGGLVSPKNPMNPSRDLNHFFRFRALWVVELLFLKHYADLLKMRIGNMKCQVTNKLTLEMY